ncbi:MAG: hypothetical protein KDD92_18225 [Caldilineaceae bacterium]|nr:hypothetical protein [Caldilineaceae bacterium]
MRRLALDGESGRILNSMGLPTYTEIRMKPAVCHQTYPQRKLLVSNCTQYNRRNLIMMLAGLTISPQRFLSAIVLGAMLLIASFTAQIGLDSVLGIDLGPALHAEYESGGGG